MFYRQFSRSRGVHRWRLLLALCLSLSGLSALAVDKSGVATNTISLPEGPGSIEGLGEAFQPTLNTGTSKYRVALTLPPGTTGFAPDLALSYEGGGGNGSLGIGWNIRVPYIQRETDEGTPRYIEDALTNGMDDDGDGMIDNVEEADVFINEMSEELVPIDPMDADYAPSTDSEGHFLSENEGAFARYRRVGDHWEAARPDGTKCFYGETASGRIADGPRTFRWMLERCVDTNGNTIVYTYESFPGELDPRGRDPNLNQIYLRKIEYGPAAPPWTNYHLVWFEYEDRPDWFEDARSGFQVRTGKRLKRVHIGTHGPVLPGHGQRDIDGDAQDDNLVRVYELSYGAHPYWSLLSEVKPIGAGGTNSLPSSTFGYAVCQPPVSVSAAGSVIGSVSEPPFSPDNSFTDLIDLNGDGLPDILKTELSGAHSGYINEGEVNTGGGTSGIRWDSFAEVSSDDGLAWTINLDSSSNVAHLADMDGDGVADLTYKSAVGDVYFFKNNSDLSWGPRRLMAVPGGFSAPPSPFGGSAEVKTADIDFDKNIDIIQSVDVGGGFADYRVWFNLGDQRYSRDFLMSPGNTLPLDNAGVMIADFNADRVPDVVRVGATFVDVIPGLGRGDFAATETVQIPDHTLDAQQIQKAKLQDITGDGLADLVIERPGGAQEIWYWCNLGNYTLDTRKMITGLPASLGTGGEIRWADLNGNGATDLIYCNMAASPKIQTIDIGELIGCVPSPNTLTFIDNGIGRKTAIEYKPSTFFSCQDRQSGQPWPDIMPNVVSVVSRVLTDDSLGNAYETRYVYHDGYYDPAEKQFRGFARVEQIDVGDASAPTLVTRHYFDTGRSQEALKGKLLRQTAETEGGGVFWDESTQWTVASLLTGTNGETVKHARPVGKQKDILELGQGDPVRLEYEFAYDGYGNQTINRDFGIVEGGDRFAANDERYSSTEYAINVDDWLIRYPSRMSVGDEGGDLVAREESFYDDETFSGSNLGVVAIGNLTLKRQWIAPNALDLDDPATYIDAARNQYDAFGNPIALLDPLAEAPGGILDPMAGHYREIAYDPLFQTYPEMEIIHVGDGAADLVFQAGYDAGFGVVTDSTDFNANVTTYGYDEFARLVNIVRPLDGPAYPTVEYDYILAEPFGASGVISYIETRQLDKPAGTQGAKRDHYHIARQFVDGLGREVLGKEEAEPDAMANPRVAVKGAVTFNARQKPASALQPFYSKLPGPALDDLLAFEDINDPAWLGGDFHENGAPAALDLASAHKTRQFYDAALRETVTVNPDGTRTVVLYEPLGTETSDENDSDPFSPHFDTPMRHFNDGLGRLTRVEEITRLNDDGTPAPDLRTWTTLYEYDLNDMLTRITDSQSNVKVMQYDGLKRKTFMNDPDRGVMSYAYDEASNLVETLDAKAQRITYTYDGVNRLRTEDYHDEGLPFSFERAYDPGQPINLDPAMGPLNQPDVTYFYDAPAGEIDLGNQTADTATNTLGYLSYVVDLAGEEHTSYDQRGRVKWTVKVIPDPETGVSSPYKTEMTYDSLDRVVDLIYPDEDRCAYQYNDRNLLERITGGGFHNLNGVDFIVQGIDYAPSSQLLRCLCGNSVATDYAYDKRLRLTNLTTAREADPGDPLIDYSYQFDGASNITRINDLRPGVERPEGDPRRNTQIFAYDDLYRLTSARYSFALPGQPDRDDGSIAYRYDRVGNMLAKTSGIEHADELTGLSVTNLGNMGYGGGLGASGRVGRTAGDPPGPHALTSADAEGRAYPYDDNGNMTDIDGLSLTWDFKDRLAAAESDNMRAEYVYDYSDRRIAKAVSEKTEMMLEDTPSTTTLYIDRYFEVREFEQPTKYVWAGDNRLARVTGSLLNNSRRCQRVKLYEGWNHLMIAVEEDSPGDTLAAIGLGTDPSIQRAFRWDAMSGSYLEVFTGEAAPRGTILWVLSAIKNDIKICSLYGEPTETDIVEIPANGGPGGIPGLQRIFLEALPKNEIEGIMVFNNASSLWEISQYNFLTDEKKIINPGEPIWRSNLANPPQIQINKNKNLEYYHKDHLGSKNISTNSHGEISEEIYYMPYGFRRFFSISDENFTSYYYAQKEIDKETRLAYFEARYNLFALGRFISLDPLVSNMPLHWKFDPKKNNTYYYSSANPINRIDKNGLDDEITNSDKLDLTTSSPIGGTGLYPSQSTQNNTEQNLEKINGAVDFINEACSIVANSTDKAKKVKFLKTVNTAATVCEYATHGVGGGMLSDKKIGSEIAGRVAGEITEYATFGSCVALVSTPAIEAGVAGGGAVGTLFAGVGALPGAVIGGFIGASTAVVGCAFGAEKVGNAVQDTIRDVTENYSDNGKHIEVRAPTYCFSAETFIQILDAKKEINDIEIGDYVLTKNINENKNEYMEVTNIHKSIQNHFYVIKTEFDEIHVTGEHPFFVKERGWTKVKNIAPNDYLVTYEGLAVPVISLCPKNEEIEVFNISVSVNKNYFVGKKGYLVHNK